MKSEEKVSIWSACDDDEGKRLDQFISEKGDITRSQAQKIIEKGQVTVSGENVRKNHRVRSGEQVTARIVPEDTMHLIPQDIPVDFVYRDSDLAVINKPPRLVMYPAAGHSLNTLMNALAFHCDHLATIGSPLRPGIVHRIDRDTSGLVVVALNDKTYYGLQEQFRSRVIVRRYLAIVHGSPKAREGEISKPIGRALSDRKKMSTRTRRGKSAVTRYRVLEVLPGASLVEAHLATGRTHQIRVHFSAVGHPILGDPVYGNKTSIRIKNQVIRIPRQMLHAESLGFVHPLSGREMYFTAPPPDDMSSLLTLLRGDS